MRKGTTTSAQNSPQPSQLQHSDKSNLELDLFLVCAYGYKPSDDTRKKNLEDKLAQNKEQEQKLQASRDNFARARSQSAPPSARGSLAGPQNPSPQSHSANSSFSVVGRSISNFFRSMVNPTAGAIETLGEALKR